MTTADLLNISISNDPITGLKRTMDIKCFSFDNYDNYCSLLCRIYRLDTDNNRIGDNTSIIGTPNGPYEVKLFASDYSLVDNTGTLQGTIQTITDPAILSTLIGQYTFLTTLAENPVALYPLFVSLALGSDALGAFNI